MKKRELIRRLQEDPNDEDTEVLIQEYSGELKEPRIREMIVPVDRWHGQEEKILVLR